jgi:hypothetical protein
MTFRKIPRDVHEDARDAARALMRTPEFAKSRNERKKVEMRFAHLKTLTTASSVCDCEAFPAHAMNSISLQSCRT